MTFILSCHVVEGAMMRDAVALTITDDGGPTEVGTMGGRTLAAPADGGTLPRHPGLQRARSRQKAHHPMTSSAPETAPPTAPLDETWVCLSGGNALGAFHVGAWQAIEDAGLRVTRLSGASIGSLVAALIAGSAPGRRIETLQRFLSRVGEPRAMIGRKSAVARTLAWGHRALFAPAWPGMWEILPGMPPDRALFRRQRMADLIDEMVDFTRLNDAAIEVTVTALNAETGLIEAFRNTQTALSMDHLMASSALPVLFTPVRIGEATYFDAGLAQNLPLPPLLDRPGNALILALDLFELQKPLRQTVDGIACRAQELAFAAQSAQVIDRCDLENRRFRHVILSDPRDDFAGKAFDYGRGVLQHRVTLGRRIMRDALHDLGAKPPAQTVS